MRSMFIVKTDEPEDMSQFWEIGPLSRRYAFPYQNNRDAALDNVRRFVKAKELDGYKCVASEQTWDETDAGTLVKTNEVEIAL